MNIKILRYIFLLALLVCATRVFADSPVWRVTKGDSTVFIAGTIHLLTESDYPLPSAFEDAYSQSDSIVLEADITETQTPEFQQKVVQDMMYPQGTTIQDFLESETLQKLEKHFESRGLVLEELSVFRPGMFTLTLTLIELQRLGLVGTGVDQHFHLRAINDGKQLIFLETVEQQMGLIATIGEGYENEFIEYTLQDIDNLGEVISDLKEAWRSGNSQRLVELGMADMQEISPQAYTTMVTDRNANWVPVLEALFSNDGTEMVLVGALHVVGEEGIIRLLGKKGYQFVQLD